MSPPDDEPRPDIPDTADVSVRFAESDEDVIAIHRFLMEVAVPVLNRNLGFTVADIDATAAMEEVYRIVHAADGAAMIAEQDGEIVGSLGMMHVSLWYARRGFYGDRWFFVRPAYKHTDVGLRLRQEADALAAANESFFLPHPKLRRRDIHQMPDELPRPATNGSAVHSDPNGA